MRTNTAPLLSLLFLIFLAACGGGGGSDATTTPASSTYSIGGAISGLTGTGLVLQNIGLENKSISANGGFNFTNQLPNKTAYSVFVLTHPNGQTCTVTNGIGTTNNANVTNIAVSCSANAISSTSGILANMGINYTNEQATVIFEVKNCVARFGSSGAGTTCSATAKQTAVQDFLNLVLANIQTVKNNAPIDKTALASALDSYQTLDLAWLSVSSIGPTTTSALIDAVRPSYNASINASYSNALLQLASM